MLGGCNSGLRWQQIHTANSLGTAPIASCPLVENGVVREMSSPHFSRRGTLAIQQVRERVRESGSALDRVFWADDVSSRDDSGVDHRHAQSLEVAEISRRQRGAACLRDACILGVPHVHRSARLWSGGGQHRSLQRGRVVEGEHAVFEVFFEELVECGRERLPSASSRQQRQAQAALKQGDAGDLHRLCRLQVQQSTTGGSGLLRISADNTLVSRMITP